jgi:mannonate dehydratase
MEQTWRWFGPRDPISLTEIRQTGATGVVTALHQVPVGEVWTVDAIMERKRFIEEHGLTWSVVESVPVHEAIKHHAIDHRGFIRNYQATIRNLGQCGIDTVCYNFMPVLDWSRTALRVMRADGAIAAAFDPVAFAVFDIHILQRRGAREGYTADAAAKADAYFAGLGETERATLTETVLLGLPGSLDALSLDGLRTAIARYDGVGEDGLRAHLREFLEQVVPVAEESGVMMAIHPDDPPWPLLGLPRVVRNAEDVKLILAVHDTPANGITLCTGSFGAGCSNDLVAMASQFAQRINFIHLRNVFRSDDGRFMETDHLGGDIDMFGVMKALVLEEHRRIRGAHPAARMPFRPDHGLFMAPDIHREGIYPGYSLFGRMRGLAELRGLELGVRRSLGL